MPAVRIVGAGPTGALLAILLQRRGVAEVELYESRPDLRGAGAESGRSINLALADRGIHALKAAGVFEALGSALLPMRGRLIHHSNGDTSFQPYGQRPNEVIYSVSRHRLNQVLLEVAARQAGIRIHFEHRFEAADFAAGTAQIRDLRQGRVLQVPMQPLLAADGAGSTMRREMSALNLIQARETDLEHGYKELSIPAGGGRSFSMPCDALHIWPRGDHMLIALPNADGSFTATLFLPKRGSVSFESLRDPEAVERFFLQQFPDARELMPHCIAEFLAHPVGFLGTIHASPWHARGSAALIGDSAHAMVPFHGQGMNCCFEDCVEFDACVARLSSWEAVFAEFGAARKPNTDAIAAMALENYLEMRERVADPKFQLQQALSLELERRFPRRFIPRYAMVMFHHEIPYLAAQQRGATQADVLAGLTAGTVAAISDVDFEQAESEIAARLPPI
ncbi:MAG: FAD-dependent oxidoreductase [Steroidobacteraceae bacterium]